MAVEHGIVTEVAAETAWVKTTRSATCEGCASKGSCMSKGDDMIVKTINAAHAAVGDQVVVSLKTGAFLRVTFLIYLFPVLCLLFGALAGQQAAAALGASSSAVSATAGFGCLIIAVVIVRRKAQRMAESTDYQPTIVRITARGVGLPAAGPAASPRR